jgi:hypothetical protein
MSALLSYEPDLGSCRDGHLGIQNDAPALRGRRFSAAVPGVLSVIKLASSREIRAQQAAAEPCRQPSRRAKAGA